MDNLSIGLEAFMLLCNQDRSVKICKVILPSITGDENEMAVVTKGYVTKTCIVNRSNASKLLDTRMMKERCTRSHIKVCTSINQPSKHDGELNANLTTSKHDGELNANFTTAKYDGEFNANLTTANHDGEFNANLTTSKHDGKLNANLTTSKHDGELNANLRTAKYDGEFNANLTTAKHDGEFIANLTTAKHDGELNAILQMIPSTFYQQRSCQQMSIK